MATVKERILIGVAWPYANNELHIGHYAGALLPPDIFARYHRMKGNDVLMVSGADSHGTPVTVTAEAEGLSPRDVVEKYHERFITSFEKMGITFDLFTTTMTENHFSVVHDLFKRHLEKGLIYKEVTKQIFDPKAGRFLPDRYVEGTCPHCGFADARGDQCDQCSKTYEAIELKNPRSKVTGSKDLQVRDTEHFFLDLAKLNEPLITWINDDQKSHWRPHVLNFTRAQLEKRDLHGRAITRDLEWGVTIPVPGYEGKRLYVWYEAVIGYLSASREWAKLRGQDSSEWERFWKNPGVGEGAKSYYFIGKDNITFHSMMWPAMLIGYGGLNLPHDVPANEYLNSAGRKFSKSRGNAIFINKVLEKYQSDAWRYVLTAIAPETADADFTWDDFLERVNSELVANWGNLVNRVLGFAYKRFDGKVPEPGVIDASGQELLAAVRGGFVKVGGLYGAVKLRSALEETRGLSQKVNQYLSEKAPWTLIKTDEKAAATAIYVALQCIEWLKVLWAPILPVSSQAIHEYLGFEGHLAGHLERKEVKDAHGKHLVMMYDHRGASGTWKAIELPAGQPLREPAALFKKLDEKEVLAEADSPEN